MPDQSTSLRPRSWDRAAAVCVRCGAAFFARTDAHRQGGGRYCGQRCYHAARKLPETAFWDKADRPGPAACWLWRAGKNPAGYGRVSVRGGPMLAHRRAWELTHGSIPSGMTVCHDCPDGDNPACINPAHLFLAPQTENIADMWRKNRGARGETRGKLTEPAVREIRRRAAAGPVNLTALGRELDVNAATIYDVIKRRTWAHIV